MHVYPYTPHHPGVSSPSARRPLWPQIPPLNHSNGLDVISLRLHFLAPLQSVLKASARGSLRKSTVFQGPFSSLPPVSIHLARPHWPHARPLSPHCLRPCSVVCLLFFECWLETQGSHSIFARACSFLSEALPPVVHLVKAASKYPFRCHIFSEG